MPYIANDTKSGIMLQTSVESSLAQVAGWHMHSKTTAAVHHVRMSRSDLSGEFVIQEQAASTRTW